MQNEKPECDTLNDPLISVAALKQLLNDNEDFELVDVRTLEKHQAFNIGGKHIPTTELPLRHNELDRNKLVVTYCTMGGNSMRALQYLRSIGFTRVKSLDGGMTAWVA